MSEAGEVLAVETMPTLKPVSFSVNDAAIEKLIEKHPLSDIPDSLDNKEDYELVTKALSSFKKARGVITREHREFKAPVLVYANSLDSSKREMIARIKEVEDPHREKKNEHDEKVEIAKREAARLEEERQEKIAQRISSIRSAVTDHIDSDSKALTVLINELDCMDFGWAGEHGERAQAVVKETADALLSLKTKALALEKANAEHAKLVKEQEERAKAQAAKAAAEREAKEREAAEAAALQKKKDDAFAAQQRQEQERIRQEHAAKEAALAEERKKFEAEKAATEAARQEKEAEERKVAEARLAKVEEQKAAEAKARSEANEAKHLDELAGALQGIIDSHTKADSPAAIAKAVITGQVPHVSWAPGHNVE